MHSLTRAQAGLLRDLLEAASIQRVQPPRRPNEEVKVPLLSSRLEGSIKAIRSDIPDLLLYLDSLA